MYSFRQDTLILTPACYDCTGVRDAKKDRKDTQKIHQSRIQVANDKSLCNVELAMKNDTRFEEKAALIGNVSTVSTVELPHLLGLLP